MFLFVIDEDQGLAKIHLQSLIGRRFKEKGPAYDGETREDWAEDCGNKNRK